MAGDEDGGVPRESSTAVIGQCRRLLSEVASNGGTFDIAVRCRSTGHRRSRLYPPSPTSTRSTRNVPIARKPQGRRRYQPWISRAAVCAMSMPVDRGIVIVQRTPWALRS